MKTSIILLPLIFFCLLRHAEFFTIEKSRGTDRQNHHDDLLLAKSDGFKLGQFMFVEATHRFTNASSISPVIASCVEHEFAQFAVLKFLSVKNLNLVEAAAVSISDSNSEALSHVLNGCTPTWKGFDNGMKELFYHVAMAVWPWNSYAVKNYGYDLEWHGHVDVARALYRSCMHLHPWERGCALHGAFAAPPLLRDERHAYDIYIRVLAEAYDIINTVFVRPAVGTSGGSLDSNSSSVVAEEQWAVIGGSLDRDPQLNVRELQLHYQYMGVLPGVLAEAYSLCLLHLYPVLAQCIPPPVPVFPPATLSIAADVSPQPKRSAVRVVRLGVFSEHEGNSSPGLCVTRIFDHLMSAQASSNHKAGTGTGTVRIHLVFFCRVKPVTVFAEVMQRVADKVIYVEHDDLDGTRAAVVGEQLDVLLYLALPTEKFTVFISAARLAPVQVQFGVGHPVGSGCASIDYSVVSEHMLDIDGGRALTEAPQIDVRRCMALAHDARRRAENSTTTNAAGSAEEDDWCLGLPAWCCNGYGRVGLPAGRDFNQPGGQRPLLYYTEQLVLFSSLGHYLDNPLLLYAQADDSGDGADADASPLSVADRPEFSGAARPLFDPLRWAYNSSCATLDAFFRKIHIDHSLRAEDVGGCWRNLPSDAPGGGGGGGEGGGREYVPKGIHLYGCLQMPKKMHPGFDRILAGVLAADPRAKVLVMERAEDLLPRWAALSPGDPRSFFPNATASSPPDSSDAHTTTVDHDHDHGHGYGHGRGPASLDGMSWEAVRDRFVFVSRTQHPDHLRLTALMSVFLNTLPYGAGITSSESLALCVPVVTLPRKVAVLQMTLAQIRAYGPRYEKVMVAASAADYVAKARAIVRNGGETGGETSDSDPDPGFEGLLSLRRSLCADRDKLFGDQQVALAVDEWLAFFARVTQ